MRRDVIFLIILIFIIPTNIKTNSMSELDDISIKQLSDDIISPNNNGDIYLYTSHDVTIDDPDYTFNSFTF